VHRSEVVLVDVDQAFLLEIQYVFVALLLQPGKVDRAHVVVFQDLGKNPALPSG
jgi:hypothetical protein